MLTKIYVSLVGHLNDMMTDVGLSVELLQFRNIHIGNSNHKLDSQGFELFDVLGASEVAYIQPALPPLSGLEYVVYFSVYNHKVINLRCLRT